MKRSIAKGIEEFRLHWKNYVFQSLFATGAILLVLISIEREVVTASLGATTFIIFALPHSLTAQPRNVIGGYIVGIICGSLFFLVPSDLTIMYALSVGLSIFIMVVTDTEHPPASGVALDFAIRGFSLELAIGVIASVVILSVIRYLFRNYLKDLT